MVDTELACLGARAASQHVATADLIQELLGVAAGVEGGAARGGGGGSRVDQCLCFGARLAVWSGSPICHSVERQSKISCLVSTAAATPNLVD